MNDKPVRWWPAVMIALLTAAAVSVIWAWPEVQRQQRYLRSAGALLLAGFLTALWFLFFSRMKPAKKIAGILLASLCLGSFAAAFRIRGVNGDLLPILEPRWKAKRTFAAPGDVPGRRKEVAPPIKTAADFPQLYGPNRNAVLDGPVLETDWTAHPPRILWKQPVGAAWSGFAVKDGLAITQEQRGGEECVCCYELLTGRPVWLHANAARYASTIAGEGPRTTPSIAGDRVYTFGGTGILNCLELQSGKVIWSRDAAKDNQARLPDWGFASSPLVIDGKVVLSVGGAAGSLVAYSADEGKLLWAEGQGGADYSSPLEAAIMGERQIIIFNGHGVNGYSLEGALLWNYRWPGGHPHVSMPVVVSSNQVLVSSGYGTGSELLELKIDAEKKWSVTRIWKGMSLKSKFGPIFVKDDYIYGLDDGILTCVELKTGQRRWKDGRYGHGQGLLVAGMILLTSEKGEVILIEPNPDKLMEKGRFPVFSDKTWNPPALVGEYLLMRDDKEAACLQLAAKKELAKNVALSFAKPILHR